MQILIFIDTLANELKYKFLRDSWSYENEENGNIYSSMYLDKVTMNLYPEASKCLDVLNSEVGKRSVFSEIVPKIGIIKRKYSE